MLSTMSSVFWRRGEECVHADDPALVSPNLTAFPPVFWSHRKILEYWFSEMSLIPVTCHGLLSKSLKAEVLKSLLDWTNNSLVCLFMLQPNWIVEKLECDQLTCATPKRNGTYGRSFPYRFRPQRTRRHRCTFLCFSWPLKQETNELWSPKRKNQYDSQKATWSVGVPTWYGKKSPT